MSKIKHNDGPVSSSELEKYDRAHLFHPSTDLKAHAHGETLNRIIHGGDGVYIVDREGKRSLDAFAGLYCVNVGYGRQEIIDAICQQAKQLSYYHAYAGHGSEPAILLSNKIIEKAPKNMCRIYYGMSGSDANETQIKMAWYYNNILGRPRKKKIISRWRGYHGSGIMTGSLTGLALFHTAFDLPREPIIHTRCPHFWKDADEKRTEREYSVWCAQQLEELILSEGPDTIAAFIGEPVLGTGGLIPPPDGYWAEIQDVLRKYDILLIADEVITGFGRIGSWFGSERYAIEPDLITIAKGLTSAYLPLSGAMVSEKVWDVLEAGSDKTGIFGHGWTYSAHPLCTAAALANLTVIEENNIIDHAAEIGEYFQTSLERTFGDHPLVGEVRGVGLLAALEFVSNKTDRKPFNPHLKVGPRIAAACLEGGLIARAMPDGDILGFAPPLIITREEIDRLIELALKGVNRTMDELIRSKEWSDRY